MQCARGIAGAAMIALGAGCQAPDVAVAEEDRGRRDRAEEMAQAALPERPVEVRAEEVPGDLPVFVLRARKGSENAKDTVVFLHGMCGHGLGYVQSFQHVASSRANVIGLQGGVACDGSGTWRKWSRDLGELDRRIGRALEATGLERPAGGVALVGYSQGGTRAIELAARFPERYRRVVVIGAPREATARELRRARAVAVMAGEHDAPRWRQAQAGALARAGIHARFFELPGASHGAMGPESERVMGEVLDWIADDSGGARGP